MAVKASEQLRGIKNSTSQVSDDIELRHCRNARFYISIILN